jgi:predicted alpha/beta superfamily hydrolase
MRLAVGCLVLLLLMNPGSCLAGGLLLPPHRFASTNVGGERIVRIRLPAGYHAAAAARFPVLYVHDGQNVFSSAGPQAAFGWGNWEIDLTADRLATEGRMRDLLIVAVDNTPARYQEYRGPAATWTEAELKDTRRRPPFPGDSSPYEAYKRFLIDELKPWVDREYRTLPDAAHTGLLGSSLGGLVSLALAWDRPDVFGLAASMSGAFQVEKRQFLDRVLKAHAGKPKPIRIYLDSGTVALGGSDDGAKHTAAVAGELRRIGWREGTDLQHFVDARPLSAEEAAKLNLPPNKQAEAQTSQHNELYWRLRARVPLPVARSALARLAHGNDLASRCMRYAPDRHPCHGPARSNNSPDLTA